MAHRLNLPIVAAALVYTALLGAQTPAAKQAPAAPAQPQYPNPGQGGVAPGDYPSQPKLTPEQQAEQIKKQSEHISELQAEAFARQMRLRPDQLAKLRPILAERQKELRAIASPDGNMTPEQRAKAIQIQADTQVKIKGILDPTQKAQYEHLIEARNAQIARRSSMAAARRAELGRIQSTPGSGATPEASPTQPAPAAPVNAPSPAAPTTPPPAAPKSN